MNELEIVINPYDCAARVNINNRPISPYSELAKYLREPFYTWCDKVLDAVSRELNDEFMINIISRQIEASILKGLAKEHEDCIEIKHKNFSIEMSIIDRFKRVLDIVNTSKINIEHGQFPINLFVCDVSKENVINKYIDNTDFIQKRDAYSFEVTEYPLCNITLNVEEYSEEKFNENLQDINIIITSNNEKAKIICNEIKQYNSPALIQVWNNSFGVQKINNIFISECRDETLLKDILEFIEFRWITPFFCRIINGIREEISIEEVELLEELRLLSNVDPFVTVHCVEQLEINTFVPLEIKSYPKDMEMPNLNYKFSKDKIVSCDGRNILALAVGEVDVEVYIQGSLEPISKFHISVIKRNKIEEIQLDKKNYVMGLQDAIKLSYKFIPENADNQGALEWSSTDERVAVVDNEGTVVALNTGSCHIKIATEDVSASCFICVKPKISNIKLSKQHINLYIGETTELIVELYPEDVINSEIIWESSDKGVAIFQNGTIKAIGIGKANITFYTTDMNVSSSCQIIVRSTFEKNEYRNRSLSLSVILFILSIVLSGMYRINVMVPILGVIFGFLALNHNNKDKGVSILFILLNIIMLLSVFFNLFRLY